MLFNGFLYIMLLIGSNAYPAEDDMSIFFDHTAISARIVGGNTAGHVPYMVALTTGENVRYLLCSGSLVTTRHVLTAAHCIVAVVIEGVLISTIRGHVNTSRYDSGGTTYAFSCHIVHPNYDPTILKNDLGFLVTTSEVTLSDSVFPVHLNFDFIEAGVKTSVTGWGSTSAGSAVSQVLLQLYGIVVSGNKCQTLVAKRAKDLNIRFFPNVDPNLEICAYNLNGGGTCNGDSGSPLVLADCDEQIGIVSWGLPCARNAPDMFTRISTYRSWIEENTNELSNY